MHIAGPCDMSLRELAAACEAVQVQGRHVVDLHWGWSHHQSDEVRVVIWSRDSSPQNTRDHFRPSPHALSSDQALKKRRVPARGSRHDK
jgi:cell division GTPase FtsZ